MGRMKIELTDNPADYGLPFTAWKPHQKKMCEAAVNLPKGSALILEGVPGSGKSGVPTLVSHFHAGATVLVSTRDLQQQYADMAEFVGCVWGRAHYECVSDSHIKDFRAMYDALPTREDCPYPKAFKCRSVQDCPYEIAKATAANSRCRVLNCHYANYARWWRDLTQDLFLDEAHRLPVVLSGLVSVEVSERRRCYYNLPPFPIAIGGAPLMLRKAALWADDCTMVLLPLTKSKDIKLMRRATRLRQSLADLRDTLMTSDDAEWYVESRPDDKFFARPVVPGPYSARLLDSNSRSFVLMSATIGDPAVLASELGITDYEFMTFPHPFPFDSRPVYYVKRSPKIRYATTNEEYELQAEIIREILRGHKGDKCVIHTASWHHAKRLERAVKGNGRRVIVPDGDRVKSVTAFKESEMGTVAISPSWKEGLNFPYDECRLTIIAKVPFLPYNDPVVKLRLKRKGGRGWYDWSACLPVVQASGRGTRFEDDYSATYIVDKCWKRVARKAPQWFQFEEI
jgi:Rad3-related DNA helicase